MKLYVLLYFFNLNFVFILMLIIAIIFFFICNTTYNTKFSFLIFFIEEIYNLEFNYLIIFFFFSCVCVYTFNDHNTNFTIFLIFFFFVQINYSNYKFNTHNLEASLNTKLLNGLFCYHPILIYAVYAIISTCYLLFRLHIKYVKYNFKSLQFVNIALLTIVKKYYFIFSGLGLILGSWWAFQEINWGGWWNWDIIEITSLLFFFFSFITLHTNKFTNSNINPNFFFFCTLIFILTRYGIYNSIHAFFLNTTTTVFFYLFYNLQKAFIIIFSSNCIVSFLFLKKKNIFINTHFFFFYIILLLTLALQFKINYIMYHQFNFSSIFFFFFYFYFYSKFFIFFIFFIFFYSWKFFLFFFSQSIKKQELLHFYLFIYFYILVTQINYLNFWIIKIPLNFSNVSLVINEYILNTNFSVHFNFALNYIKKNMLTQIAIFNTNFISIETNLSLIFFFSLFTVTNYVFTSTFFLNYIFFNFWFLITYVFFLFILITITLLILLLLFDFNWKKKIY